MVKKPQAPQVVKDNPAISAGSAMGFVSLVLGLLVTHHVIGSADVDTWQKIVDPLVAGALPLIAGVIAHVKVTPMSKVRSWIVAQSHGMLTDVDVTRIALAVLEQLEQAGQYLPVGEAHADAERVGPPAVPTRQAGAAITGHARHADES